MLDEPEININQKVQTKFEPKKTPHKKLLDRDHPRDTVMGLSLQLHTVCTHLVNLA